MQMLRWLAVGLSVWLLGCIEPESPDVSSDLDACLPCAPLTFVQGPDDSTTIPPTDVVLVSNVTAERIWTVAESSCLSRMRFVARDNPGFRVLLYRENNTTMGAFDGTGQGWITLHRHDEGAGVTWSVVGWSGAVTIPGDP